MNIADLLRTSGRSPDADRVLELEPTEDTSPRHDDPLYKLRTKAQEALFERLGARLFDPNLGEDQLRAYAVKELDQILAAEADQLTSDERHELVESIGADIMGLGPIESLLADPTVTEIMVNADDAIFVERGGRLYLTEARFVTVAHLRQVIERIVAAIGRRIDESSPMVDARLPDGTRVNAVIPPLAVDGPMLTIRKFAKTACTTSDLIEFGTSNRAVRRLPRRLREGQAQHPDQRWHRYRQDHAAQHRLLLHPEPTSGSSPSRMRSSSSSTSAT